MVIIASNGTIGVGKTASEVEQKEEPEQAGRVGPAPKHDPHHSDGLPPTDERLEAQHEEQLLADL